MPPFRIVAVLVALLVTSLLFTGCASGPPKRVFPPQARIQELLVAENGHWTLRLRVQNFSNVPITYDRVDVAVSIDGRVAGQIALTPELVVGPGSAEILSPTLNASPEAIATLAAALKSRAAVRYQITGNIHSVEPNRDYPIDYQSALNPVPGLSGVLR